MKKIPSIKELRQTASKKSTNGFLNPMCDYLAFYPAKLFLYLPFNPVQITVIWILIKIVMALLLIKGGYLLTVVALTIFQLASILDGVDGIVARYRKDYSYNGIYLDYIGHYLCNSLLLICLGLGTYLTNDNIFALFAGLMGAFFYLLAKSITVNPSAWLSNPEMREKMQEMVYAKELGLKNRQKGFLALMADFLLMDNPLNLMFWGIILGFPGTTLWVYALALFIEALRRMFVQYYRIYAAEKEEKE